MVDSGTVSWIGWNYILTPLDTNRLIGLKVESLYARLIGPGVESRERDCRGVPYLNETAVQCFQIFHGSLTSISSSIQLINNRKSPQNPPSNIIFIIRKICLSKFFIDYFLKVNCIGYEPIRTKELNLIFNWYFDWFIKKIIW